MKMWIPALLCLVGVASGYEDKTIAQYLADNPSAYSELSGLISIAGISSELMQDGTSTLFAPTNAAFANLDNATLSGLKSNPGKLANILRYHLISEYVLVPMISQPEQKTTTEGQLLNISASGGSLLLNGVATVDVNPANHDIILRNGVVQPIDKVLFPPLQAELNIAQLLLKDDTRFKDIFLSLLLADLANLLQTGDYTFFAPVDSAFAAVSDTILSTTAPNAPEVYKAVVNYHIIPGGRRSRQLSDGESLFTLHGSPVNITVGTGMMVNGANIIDADILAVNGVVHAIDRVLIPSNINQIMQG